MCGFAGFLSTPVDLSVTELERQVRGMIDEIRHRGPDGEGVWADAASGVALGHRRLSIIDLSPQGSQPMTSHDGRWVIAYNGEIYNFERMRAELEKSGVSGWRGHSDTEVLLEAVAVWGVERALQATIGMFSFALWDRAERRLILARDRAGEKPLYYGRFGRTLLFGSELKALRSHPQFCGTIAPAAVSALMRFGYVPTPLSIYEDVYKLEPGTYACFDSLSRQSQIVRYWEPPFPNPDPALADPQLAVSQLENLLSDAVGLQMRADVPMGAFLSGGVDSSMIVALMQRQSARPVKSFSIGFGEVQFDESQHAAAVAEHLGTEHRELVVSAEDALDLVPSLSRIYDEPFADSSQIPTHLLAKLTREHVTVSLSGDAGDELFGGYTRYFQAQQFQRLWEQVPGWARYSAAGLIDHIPEPIWNGIRRIAPMRIAELVAPSRIAKTARALRSRDLFEVYDSMASYWGNGSQIVRTDTPHAAVLDSATLRAAIRDPIEWMMAVDLRSYLSDDILVKVDRAAMAASLETRVPMLDHRIIEFSARLPLERKMSKGKGKLLLRQLLYKYVPSQLIERPKQGFSVPIGSWLRGPLREWAEELLKPKSLEDGLLNSKAVTELWISHKTGQIDAQDKLWAVLMYQAWRTSI